MALFGRLVGILVDLARRCKGYSIVQTPTDDKSQPASEGDTNCATIHTPNHRRRERVARRPRW